MRLLLALLVTVSAGMAASGARAQDRDADHVPDAVDLCPDAREPATTLFPGDGCPEADGDHDGIVDDYDVCPGSPETVNGHRDLDGCPDTVPATVTEPPPSRLGCWEGEGLLDVTSTESGVARLVPRADAPSWMGPSGYDCYAAMSFEGRSVVHCESADHVREATLVLRSEDAHAIGFVAVRSASGVERRSWSGTRLGSFDPHAIGVALREHQAEVDACYTRELAERGLSGRVVIRATFGTTGETRDVEVASNALGDPEVGLCLVRVVDALSLASPPTCGEMTVRLPFTFQLDDEATP